MSNEMVKRVAKAVGNVIYECDDQYIYENTNYLRDIAKAAIVAMREPTVVMLDAGIKQKYKLPLVSDVYQNMIDEALKDD